MTCENLNLNNKHYTIAMLLLIAWAIKRIYEVATACFILRGLFAYSFISLVFNTEATILKKNTLRAATYIGLYHSLSGYQEKVPNNRLTLVSSFKSSSGIRFHLEKKFTRIPCGFPTKKQFVFDQTNSCIQLLLLIYIAKTIIPYMNYLLTVNDRQPRNHV